MLWKNHPVSLVVTCSYKAELPWPVPGSFHPSHRQMLREGQPNWIWNFICEISWGGNKKEGTIQASRSPSLPPPRVLQGPLLPFLLDDDCSINCIPTQALVQQLKTRNGEGSDSSIARDIQERVTSYRSKASRSFYARAPWTKEAVTDQYYFDFTAYAFWRAAADLLPDYIERDKFFHNIKNNLILCYPKRSLLGSTAASWCVQ